MKNLIRDERGAALIIALILLLIGGLISAALLHHMGSGTLAGIVHERRTAELYAADAGVEDAIWWIHHQNEWKGAWPCNRTSPPAAYNITDINGKRLQISINYIDGSTYKITSVAITDGNDDGGIAAIDSSTTVEAYVSFSYMDFSSLLDHAIVSQDIIDIQPGVMVDGDVWLPDKNDLEIHDPADITGDVKDSNNMTITWPTYGQLSGYYLDQVDPSDPYLGNNLDIKDTKNIGACYIEGDFVVDNTGDPATLTLDGTVYVAGDLEFRQSGSHGYTVDLNGHTIFAEGSIEFPSNAVTVSGSGCIIAVGYINFQPSIVSGEDDFVLVMSITDRVDFKPSGEFTGCVAGNTEVQLQPGCTINWIDPEGKGLNFPGADGGEEPPSIAVIKIDSWEIIQQ